jgi:hypothetical protein
MKVNSAGPRAGVMVWLAVMAGDACGAGAVRPRFAPFRDAISDTVTVSPDSAIEIAALLLADEGVELHHVRPIEGYLQTRWFDVTTHERVSPQSADWDSRAVIRIWADAVTENRTLVVAEAAMARVVDPSLPARETEISVPQNHPARAVLEHVLELLRARIEGGADR